ncbi:TauD/TfdA dioxygenase family protein [Paraburkholderia ferrariae]|uniref:TauD/TfdA dioxygenase family protein n=1 Tax=Paraburkholderia ferrariae TaxID=386056 RepID=UPI000481F1F5|nr:TauD/TfdA family dioxygenase [Paraburkholderia ferrariae]
MTNGMTAVGFSVKPMRVGAEIVGLDLEKPISDATRAALYATWLEHGILLFREAVKTNAQHLALSRCFGKLEMHPMPEIRAKDEPYLIELGGSRRGSASAYVYDGDQLREGRLPWHRDTAYTLEICKGALLRLVEVPPKDGETLFADSQKAYDQLPEATKQRIDKLEFKATLRMGPFQQSRPGALWHSVRPATPEEFSGSAQLWAGKEIINRYPSVVHPVVIQHPETGRKSLYISPTYIDTFIGMDQVESDALLAELAGYLADPSNVYAHHWTPNDVMLWDNRRFLHAAMGFDPQYHRTGLRTTLAGALRSGRYFAKPAEDFLPAANIND